MGQAKQRGTFEERQANPIGNDWLGWGTNPPGAYLTDKLPCPMCGKFIAPEGLAQHALAKHAQ